MKRIILCLMLVSSIALPSWAANLVDKYVDNLVKDGLNILNDTTIDQQEKVAKTKKLILANLDLKGMAKFTLGVYKAKLTDQQIDKFTEVYSHYVSKAYADLVENYHGQQPTILGVNPQGKSAFIVSMSIGTVKVDYLVREMVESNNNHCFKVANVTTEGVSLIHSQQSEFMNILSSKGFDALIEELTKKS